MVNVNRPESDPIVDSPTAPRVRVSDRLLSVPDNAPEVVEANAPVVFSATGVDVYYGSFRALHGVDLDIGMREVMALIGASGCGKSTFLRCFNRMNDTIPTCRVTGRIDLDGDDVYGDAMDVVQLRARVGMVFQKPNPFPKSIYDNIAYGPRIHGLFDTRDELDGMVENALRSAGLWKEVKDRLQAPGAPR